MTDLRELPSQPLAVEPAHVGLMVKASVQAFGDRPATRVLVGKRWVVASYRELDARAMQIAAALMYSGVEKGDRVGFYSRNRPEWTQVDLACQFIGAVSVPIYATDTVDEVVYIANDCGMVVAFAGRADEAERMGQASERIPSLRRVISFDSCPRTDVTWLEYFAPSDRPVPEQVVSRINARLNKASGDDLFSIIYTSGTTGAPKGVKLAHRAIMSELGALHRSFPISTRDHSLCFLPLSHALERGWTCYLWAHGCMNTYVVDTRKVGEMMRRARPTLMVAVPKLFETVLAEVHKASAVTPRRKRILQWAVSVGQHLQFDYRQGRKPLLLWRAQLPLADRLVLRKIREAMGGQKTMLVSGGAPLRRETELFFGAAGLQILNGYGMTEAAPLISYNTHTAYRVGSVGRVMPGGRIKLGDKHEILYQGPNVMDGYWDNEEATREAFLTDDEGTWLRTGDVGRIDRRGFLFVTDRLKDIIVTEGGKNISPQPIEELLQSDPMFEHVVVLGDNRPFLTLLVQPSMANLQKLAEALHIDYGHVSELFNNQNILDEIKKSAEALTKNLPKYQQFRDLRMSSEGFSIANGLLTPTLKVKRREVELRFRGLIDEMYTKIGLHHDPKSASGRDPKSASGRDSRSASGRDSGTASGGDRGRTHGQAPRSTRGGDSPTAR
ncbi:long-chain fatty acid--CoA ligase [Propionibacterium freudenreichii]|uniref:AMP-dependent synthetase/ligase n=1 Tax=Propionibacterium freudenreichii TaxID=1744 RepID=UPI00254A27D2|nr:long-chain fatty acid--CoA ligase [Propionibacterium freudenreichii]MCT3011113.1 long-chain fatty acid--CoA ligase [Propionibacterium freudenreichii]MDK9321530.1 long-chain fatty acid--CoA ligase [Propionibacterium freudenreichii]MDK9323902.1 long-chain fatty acid--CoA ligase [Propionibacterium freudenreichii]